MQLDDYLVKNNIPVETFADEIGVHRTSIYRYMKGLSFPRPEHIRRIDDATGGRVTYKDFLALVPVRAAS